VGVSHSFAIKIQRKISISQHLIIHLTAAPSGEGTFTIVASVSDEKRINANNKAIVCNEVEMKLAELD
jgi:hypothetical protein